MGTSLTGRCVGVPGQVLNLTRSSLGDEGAVTLGSLLPLTDCLQELHLAYNGIGPQGGKALSIGLGGNAASQAFAVPAPSPSASGNKDASGSKSKEPSGSFRKPREAAAVSSAAGLARPGSSSSSSNSTLSSSGSNSMPEIHRNSSWQLSQDMVQLDIEQRQEETQAAAIVAAAGAKGCARLSAITQYPGAAMTLQLLDLSGNKLGSSLDSIVAVLPLLVALNYLNLSNCQLTGGQMSKVRQ
jgi:Leucine Rich repeat